MKANVVVVVPVCRPDFHLCLKWIAWARWLAGRTESTYDIVIFAAASLESRLLGKIDEAITGWAECRLEVNPEYYEKPELGYAAMANHGFRRGLEMTERLFPGRPTQWCEPDCIPCRATWVQEIDAEYAACGQPFMGDFHALGAIPHLTGNAVYSATWRLDAPSIARLPLPNPPQGWDTQCSRDTVPKSHRTTLIQQAWIVPPPHFTEQNANIVHRSTALFHRCKDGSLIDVIAARMGAPRFPLTEPVAHPTPTKPHRLIVQPAQPVHRFGSLSAPPKIVGPRTHILIVSCRKDSGMLGYCLRSIEKHAVGFAGVTLLIPDTDLMYIRNVPDMIRTVTFKEQPGKGFLHHMIQVCRADEVIPDAEIIVHVDSDNLFWQKVTPQDYAPSGKCLIVRQHYDEVRMINRNRMRWRECVNNATGFMPEYDTMVRHPNVYPKQLYSHVRNIVENHTKKQFNAYVFDGQDKFPQNFCEFVTLGNIGLRDFPDLFEPVDYDYDQDCREFGIKTRGHQYLYKPGRDKMVEGWTHGGLEKYRTDWTRFLSGILPRYYLK